MAGDREGPQAGAGWAVGGHAIGVVHIQHRIYTERMTRTPPLTVNQAAEQLNVAPAHVRLMIKRGRIAATMFANVWMVDAASVKQYARLYRRIGYGRPRKSRNRSKTP